MAISPNVPSFCPTFFTKLMPSITVVDLSGMYRYSASAAPFCKWWASTALAIFLGKTFRCSQCPWYWTKWVHGNRAHVQLPALSNENHPNKKRPVCLQDGSISTDMHTMLLSLDSRACIYSCFLMGSWNCFFREASSSPSLLKLSYASSPVLRTRNRSCVTSFGAQLSDERMTMCWLPSDEFVQLSSNSTTAATALSSLSIL